MATALRTFSQQQYELQQMMLASDRAVCVCTPQRRTLTAGSDVRPAGLLRWWRRENPWNRVQEEILQTLALGCHPERLHVSRSIDPPDLLTLSPERRADARAVWFGPPVFIHHLPSNLPRVYGVGEVDHIRVLNAFRQSLAVSDLSAPEALGAYACAIHNLKLAKSRV